MATVLSQEDSSNLLTKVSILQQCSNQTMCDNIHNTNTSHSIRLQTTLRCKEQMLGVISRKKKCTQHNFDGLPSNNICNSMLHNYNV